MEKILFKEVQQFTQLWLWALLILSFGFPVIMLVAELIVAIRENSDEVIFLGFILLFISVIGAVLGVLFVKMKLITEITHSEIRFKYPPFIPKWKTIKKDEIEHFEVRKYRPLAEYGGWGIKSNWKKRNMAYNVSGNIGLQLYLKSGRKILLGTQRVQEIEYGMKKMLKEENSN